MVIQIDPWGVEADLKNFSDKELERFRDYPLPGDTTWDEAVKKEIERRKKFCSGGKAFD